MRIESLRQVRHLINENRDLSHKNNLNSGKVALRHKEKRNKKEGLRPHLCGGNRYPAPWQNMLSKEALGFGQRAAERVTEHSSRH